MHQETTDQSTLPQCFILGSCVTRDAFGAGSAAAGVSEYVARSPFGSMFAKRPNSPFPNFDSIESRFQRRMVQLDWEKSVPELLEKVSFDYVLVDLIDERFDLAEVGGSIATVSNELRLTSFDLSSVELARFGSPRHQELFERGFDALVKQVGAERIIVSRVFWAKTLRDGTATGSPAYIESSNEALRKLYAHLEPFGLTWIEYPEDVLVGDPKHRWGVSPFHFVEDFYQRTRDELRKIYRSQGD